MAFKPHGYDYDFNGGDIKVFRKSIGLGLVTKLGLKRSIKEGPRPCYEPLTM